MAGKLMMQILLLCLFIIFVAEIAALDRCPKSKIACLCGEQPNVEVKLFEIQSEFIDSESKNCTLLSSQVCASHSCLFSTTDASNSVVDVEKRTLRDNLFYPVKIVFPVLYDDARESHRMLRDRRSVQKCSTPYIEHASMACYLWGEFISCDIKCSQGYAFEDDGKVMLETKRVCRMSKSVWSPKNTFPVCKPYINCQAILVKPGELKCYPGPEIRYCNISCKMDIENSYGEVAMDRYECDKHFAENLPHCATVDKSVDVIQLPENYQMTVPKTG